MKLYTYPERNQWPELLERPATNADDLRNLVLEVFSRVRNEGDIALKNYTRKFDGVALDSIAVEAKDLNEAQAELPEALVAAIDKAYANISKFHESQKAVGSSEIETSPGVKCWSSYRPIEKVGLYIPGGTAPLFSTVLMLAIPAQLAGCKEIILCTPPGKSGDIHPAIRYAAWRCGIEKVYRVGGIQAIAAMTFGTQSIPQVYKLFGPGNSYVTKAKQLAQEFGVAIDMPAGPSELLCVADQTANPAFIASDLLSQAEHGVDSQVLLLSSDPELLEHVSVALEDQLPALPRKNIAEKALGNSKSILLSSAEQIIDFVNAYAPEHLIICVKDEEKYLDNINNAGSVFLGNYTPESAGDYASGTNHTLPTNGFARQYSGVNLHSFTKRITYQRISEQGMLELGPAIEIMAEEEGLFAHKNAVSLRLEYLKSNNPK